MTPVLHVSPNSIGLAVHAALEEAGATYEVVWLDLSKGQQTSADYLALNPKGRVPALVTKDGILTEALALLDWIAQTHPEVGLMPTDPWQAAKVREMMAYLASTVHIAHAHKLRGHRWADDPATHDAMRAKVAENMAASAAYMQDRLHGDWVGPTFSVADVYLWTMMRWMEGDGVPLANYPALDAHSARVAARPAVARIAALHG